MDKSQPAAKSLTDAAASPDPAVSIKPPAAPPKYLRIVESLRANIHAGHYRNGARLPSEAELVRRFGVSRMTAVKAVQQLQQEGLLTRRTGSGTYASELDTSRKPVFGLIIPDLGQTEIFEPICKGMAATPNAGGHSLAWGHSAAPNASKEDEAEHLCQQYIDQRVSGVFFAPVEFGPRRDAINRRVLKSLKSAHIPVVLLDRCVLDYPSRSDYDLVGLDNRRAGFVMTDHLLQQGAQRVGFLAVEGSAETVDDRIVGYREALFARNIPYLRERVLRTDPTDSNLLAAAINTHGIDAFLCANDNTAARLMRTLLTLGLDVPRQVRIAGIDDVRYASLLPVPLTTLHQPCLEIGAAAIAAMQDRIANPHLAARSILLNGHLVVRKSCGSIL
jgi:DNA-binding LacI/PurR family transcriptional regulator